MILIARYQIWASYSIGSQRMCVLLTRRVSWPPWHCYRFRNLTKQIVVYRSKPREVLFRSPLPGRCILGSLNPLCLGEKDPLEAITLRLHGKMGDTSRVPILPSSHFDLHSISSIAISRSKCPSSRPLSIALVRVRFWVDKNSVTGPSGTIASASGRYCHEPKAFRAWLRNRFVKATAIRGHT
jgi:hypothetical protein